MASNSVAYVDAIHSDLDFPLPQYQIKIASSIEESTYLYCATIKFGRDRQNVFNGTPCANRHLAEENVAKTVLIYLSKTYTHVCRGLQHQFMSSSQTSEFDNEMLNISASSFELNRSDKTQLSFTQNCPEVLVMKTDYSTQFPVTSSLPRGDSAIMFNLICHTPNILQRIDSRKLAQHLQAQLSE